jgi:hypothetical protein
MTLCEDVEFFSGILIDVDEEEVRATVLVDGSVEVQENVPLPLGLKLGERLKRGEELDCRMIRIFGQLLVLDVFSRLRGMEK